jgi:hypothetical protein
MYLYLRCEDGEEFELPDPESTAFYKLNIDITNKTVSYMTSNGDDRLYLQVARVTMEKPA